MKVRLIIVALLLATATARTRAQDDPEILFSSPFIWEWQYISTALGQLGLGPHTTLLVASDIELLTQLRAQEWDLIIIRWYFAFAPSRRDEIADELETHIQRGGRLMFSMAQIEQNPQLWDLLGIADTESLVLPLGRITPPGDGLVDPTKRHPAFSGVFAIDVGEELYGPDYGDELIPAPGAFAIANFEDTGTAAIIASRAGRVIVIGAEMDNWDSRFITAAEDQIRWLLSCPADLDGDGEATVFDFLEFQNLFGVGDPRADVFFDGRLDLFDFLEFFNQFEHAC